jgi:hypothetical protein
MSAADWTGGLVRSLNELEAFDAMRAFLEAYWERGGSQSDDIAVLLGSINRGDGPPLDVAQWQDWRDAIDRTLNA